MTKTFSIYRSSAGSGKTRTLAKEYLKLALKYRDDYFKYILAVTFTNKASQEMKDRILEYLDHFANGRPNELAQELKDELGLDDQTFRQNSQAVQEAVLHKYSQFSISTIDAFFQKVIRSFTREAGLTGDYRLEVEHDEVLEEVINNLIDELGTNKELTEWVVEFAKENLENERAWDVRYNLIEFAKEIFREEFKSIEDELLTKTNTATFFKDLMNELRRKRFSFINFIKGKANEAVQVIQENGLNGNDFKYSGGAYNFFVKASKITRVKDFDEKEKGKRSENEFLQVSNWPDKETPHTSLVLSLAGKKLIPLMNDIVNYWKNNFESALSAETALNNFYAFGLIADIARKLKEYKDENNVMLLADAPKFLNGVIQDSDTPFIYEKVGSFYRNYLIDEFQDTSGMQWKNFQPLIVNSLDQNYTSLVVGDVKQAIYRWRGGDLSLLQQHIVSLIGRERVEVKELDKNFRSAFHIVHFNNALFESASAIVAVETGTQLSSETYTDVAQKNFKTETGFVSVQFIKEDNSEKKSSFSYRQEDTDSDIPSRWQSVALEHLTKTLEELQLLGAQLKDIAILVRRNEEGQRIASHLLQYKNSGKGHPDCKYEVVSNESLRIDGASGVNLLLGAMRYLLNTDDAIARAQLGYEFSRLHEPKREPPEVFSVTNQTIFENNLPEDFKYQKASLKKLPLIELTETLIEIFKLGKNQGELVYLQAFQDLVLDFYNRERNDLGAFLEWWEDNKYKKSVQISGDVNAVQILTIHKAKGLQFNYVIIPFCAWSMDHDNFKAPNLWVKSDQAPFTQAGYLPVRYQQILKQTYFSSFYNEERTRCYLDNLNLLYVALTRAERGLIVTAPHPDIRGIKGTVAGLMFNSIQSSLSLKKNWDETQTCWRSGEWSIPQQPGKDLSNAISLSEYFSSVWRDKLVIRKSGSEFFSELDSDQRQKINYGIHMHTVLSRMKYADDIENTLEQIIMEGLITHEDKKPLQAQLNELLSLPQVGNWFSRDWDVHTEVPILVPRGAESRLDRLIVKNKKAIVIDFKTGERKKNDSQQVQEYLEILRQMNFIEVEGYLLYLRDKEVIEVKTGGKQKIVKKSNDKDQLSLGF